MNITQISLRDFRSWEHLDLTIEPGVSLLAGQNGAGKSSILEAALFAMYGATSDAGSYIRRGTDETRVTLWADTEGGVLTITRSVRRSGGKVAVRLDEVWLDGVNFTAATTSESQKALDAFLGVSREVLLASAFSTQHGGAAFTEAAPRDRKRVFSEVLALGMWDTLHDLAKAEQRDARAIAAAAKVRADQLDGADERRLAAWEELERVGHVLYASQEAEREAEEEATRLAAQAEAAREARRQHAAAVEAAERARADHQRATQERTAADEALARAKAATANAPDLTRAQQEAHEADLQLAEIEAEQAKLRKASTKWNEQLAEAERERRVCAEGRDEVALRMMRLRERLATASGDVCPECRQELLTEEARELPARMRDDLAKATEQLASCDEGVEIWQTRIDYLKTNSGIAPDDAKLRIFQRRVQDAQTALARAESIQSLAGSIEAAQQRARDAMDREGDTAEQLRIAEPSLTLAKREVERLAGDNTAHDRAIEALGAARLAHRAAAAALATAEAAAKHAEEALVEERSARASLAEATQREAVASILAAGFGPSGVPSLIIDNVLGQLADESNRVLAELGTPIRVDLRSQRVTQKGDLVDALDIIVLDGVNEAPYETLSGGERTRVALALRAALTRLLAAKSGARVRLLVVDEPSGLDAAGAEAFADVLQAFIAAGIFETCIVVTHDERLADRIDRVVRIEKSPGGASRLVESSAGSPPTFPGIPSSDSAEHTPEVVDA